MSWLGDFLRWLDEPFEIEHCRVPGCERTAKFGYIACPKHVREAQKRRYDHAAAVGSTARRLESRPASDSAPIAVAVGGGTADEVGGARITSGTTTDLILERLRRIEAKVDAFRDVRQAQALALAFAADYPGPVGEKFRVVAGLLAAGETG